MSRGHVQVSDFIQRGFEVVERGGGAVSTGRADSQQTDDSKRSFARAQCAEHLRYIIGAAVTDGSFTAVGRLEAIRRLSNPEWLDNPTLALGEIDAVLAATQSAIDAYVRQGLPIHEIVPRAGEYPLFLRASDLFLKYNAALLRMKLIEPAAPTLFAEVG